LALSVGVLCWRLSITADALTAAANHSGAVLDGAAQALKTINTPKSGTLSMLDDTILQGRLTIDATNQVLIHEQRQLSTFDGYAAHLDRELSGVAQHADTTLSGIDGTASAATGTLTAATTTLQTANETITAFRPVLVGATEAEGNINAYIKGDMIQKTIPSIAAHLDAGIVTGDAIAADAHVWSHPFLNPDPCKTRKCKFGRYVWPVIKTGLGLGSDVNGWERAAGKPLNVKTQ
jgi:hypothetical protein